MNYLKPTHLRTILRLPSAFSPSSLSIFVRRFSTSHGHLSYPHQLSRRQDESSRNVRVLVWWDLESCQVPAGVNALKVAHMVTAAVRANGIKGPLQITAFGDVLHLTRATQEAFSHTGINIAHVPRGGKNSADRSIIVDMMHWVSQNPPPAHLFIISGDKDFSSILHRLRMNNYNVLLASPESASTALCSAASIMWHWNALINGENLTGRHFNAPPDGPYGSWYGHDHVPLEDPFSVDLPSCAPAEEFSEASSDSKIRPVPKAVIKHIQDILSNHPRGISITDLRAELNIDKEFYGHKKFSRFLASLNQILRVQNGPDGQLHVRRITPIAVDSANSSPALVSEPACRTGEHDFAASSKFSDNEMSVRGQVKGKPVRHPNPVLNSEAGQVGLQPGQQDRNKLVKTDAERLAKNVSESPSTGEKIIKKPNEHLPEALPVSVPQGTLPSKVELINLNGSGPSGDTNSGIVDADKKHAGKTNLTADQMLESSPNSELVAEKKMSVGAVERKSEKEAGFLVWIFNWFRFWRHSQDGDSLGDPSKEKPIQRDSSRHMNEIFTKDSFWNDIKQFMCSSKASILVSQSRSRKEMAETLLKEGPLAIKTLTNSDLLQFVDLLIMDKKWVEECFTQVFPFRVKITVEKSSDLGHPHIENGLRSIVMDKSDENLQGQPFGEKKSQSMTQTGVSATFSSGKSFERSRSEILADCQKLVEDLLKKHPQGYNIVSFRSVFLQRYGYPLSTQKLGYNKLSSLLDIMPGVKIESNYLLPLNMVPNGTDIDSSIPEIQQNAGQRPADNSNSDSSATPKKDSNHDSPWDELGPVSSTSSSGKRLQSGRSQTVEESRGQLFPDYEPCLSDDELSEMGDETSNPRQGAQAKSGVGEEDSSLLQLLDSYYSTKGSSKGKESPEEVGNTVDCSAIEAKPSGMSGVTSKSEACWDNRRRQKPHKSYSFVEENNDRVVQSILGTLKKSGESKMHS